MKNNDDSFIPEPLKKRMRGFESEVEEILKQVDKLKPGETAHFDRSEASDEAMQRLTDKTPTEWLNSGDAMSDDFSEDLSSELPSKVWAAATMLTNELVLPECLNEKLAKMQEAALDVMIEFFNEDCEFDD